MKSGRDDLSRFPTDRSSRIGMMASIYYLQHLQNQHVARRWARDGFPDTRPVSTRSSLDGEACSDGCRATPCDHGWFCEIPGRKAQSRQALDRSRATHQPIFFYAAEPSGAELGVLPSITARCPAVKPGTPPSCGDPASGWRRRQHLRGADATGRPGHGSGRRSKRPGPVSTVGTEWSSVPTESARDCRL